MAATDGILVVLDAGPLIHLDELDFAALLIPYYALAFWTAPVLCRFRLHSHFSKRQRTGALQNLSAIWTVHGQVIHHLCVRKMIAEFPQHCSLHISRALLKRFVESIPD